MPFDAISYLLAKIALAKGIRLPTLKDLVIDTDKDWQGYKIKNLGEPIDPNDAARRIYVDVATTGLGINYYLLDAADSEVSAYKQLSLTPPELSEAYVETAQNSAGDYEIASWIAPADLIPVLRLGVYTLHFQAERVSGNIDVRFFFRLYERDSGGNETLIAESSLSDLVADRRDVVVSLVLPHDYELSEGSRLVVKVYARYLSGGSSTTVRLYYQGAVRSRLATPIAKEILDNIYAGVTHASRHALGGPDELSLDASQIVSGVLSADRIPDLDASKITSGVLDLARIPNIDWSRISGNFPRDISDLISSAFSRSWISDFFSAPFWDNIPDKPSTFPPDSHTHSVSDITFDGSVIPTEDNAYDLGSPSLRLKDGYFAQWAFVGYQVVPQDPIWVEDFDTDHSTDWEITDPKYLSVTWDTENSRLILENPGAESNYAVYIYKGRQFTWNNVQIIYDVEYEESGVWGGPTLFGSSYPYIDVNTNRTGQRGWADSNQTVYPSIGGGFGPALSVGRHKVVINIIGGTYMEVWVDGKLYWAGFGNDGELRKGLFYFGIVSPHNPGARFYVYKVEIRPLTFRAPTTDAQHGLFTPSGHIQAPNGSDIIFGNNITPETDNTHDLGLPSLRWRNAHVVNLYTGDVVFQNGWKITEYDENGKLMDGLRILDKNGEEIFKITEDGLYFKGKKIA